MYLSFRAAVPLPLALYYNSDFLKTLVLPPIMVASSDVSEESDSQHSLLVFLLPESHMSH